MKIFMVLVFSSAIALTVSCQKNTIHQKFDCVNSSGDLCVIPFEKILSDRRLFDGKLISLSGVVSIEGGAIYLYPDIGSKANRIHEKSILIKSDSKFLSDIKYFDGKYCGVTGRVEFENGDYWTALNLTNDIQPLPVIIDNFPPAPPKPEKIKN